VLKGTRTKQRTCRRTKISICHRNPMGCHSINGNNLIRLEACNPQINLGFNATLRSFHAKHATLPSQRNLRENHPFIPTYHTFIQHRALTQSNTKSASAFPKKGEYVRAREPGPAHKLPLLCSNRTRVTIA
jgi:hypothetical protein